MWCLESVSFTLNDVTVINYTQDQAVHSVFHHSGP